MAVPRRSLVRALLVVIAVLLLWWLLRDEHEQRPPPQAEIAPAERAAQSPLLGSAGSVTPPAEAPSPDPAPRTEEPRPEAPPAVAANRVRFEGTLRHAKTGAVVDPGTVQLFVQSLDDRDRLENVEVQTDGAGGFQFEFESTERLELTGIYAPVDAWLPHAWYRKGGRRGQRKDARPGESLSVVVELLPLLSLAGVVVNEEGDPLSRVRIHWRLPKPGGGYVLEEKLTLSGRDGRFNGVRLLEQPGDTLRGGEVRKASEVVFEREGYAARRINVHAVPESDRAPWHVVLSRGLTVSGRLLDEDGAGIANVTVEAVFPDPARGRTAQTDAGGHFTIRTLSPGSLVLRALVLSKDTEANLPIDLVTDRDGIELVAKPLDLTHPLKPRAVMGLRLVDVDDALRKKHRVRNFVHVYVVDPGANHQRLGLGPLQRGSGITHVGETPVMSVKHFVERLLVEHDEARKRFGKRPGPFRIIVRCTYGPGRKAGWPYLKVIQLMPEDIAALRRAARSMR